jgi:hypothetical protein
LIRGHEELEGTVAVAFGQRAHRELLGELGGVDQAFFGTETAKSSDLACREKEDHEQRVDDRGSGLEEVVVVRGHELAGLVDEGAEASPAEHRGGKSSRRRKVEEQKQDRDEHPEAAPEDVSDMETSAAELRVIGRREDDPDDDDRRHGGDQERVQQVGVGRADEESRADVHRAIVRVSKRERPPRSGGLSALAVDSRRRPYRI